MSKCPQVYIMELQEALELAKYKLGQLELQVAYWQDENDGLVAALDSLSMDNSDLEAELDEQSN